MADGDADFAFDVQALALGMLYRKQWDALKDTDWVAGLLIGRTEGEGTFTALGRQETADASTNFQEAYLGIRRTLDPKLEFELGANAFRSDEDGDIDVTADVKLVYRVRPPIDVAIAGNELGGADILGIGVRYSW